MPRRTKYTPERVKQICEVLAEGNPRRTACVLAGITDETFYAWMRQHPAFSDAVAKAEQEAVRRNVAIIQRAAERTWQAAAWWLERRYPHEFGLKQQLTAEDSVTAKLDELLRRADDAARAIIDNVQPKTG